MVINQYFLTFMLLVNLSFDVIVIESLYSCSADYPDCPWEKGTDKINTVCLRNMNCGPDPGCVSIESHPEFRRWSNDKHNALRNKLASGNDTRGGNSNAAGMHVLNYHFELEFTAKCHINRCIWAHDVCRLIKEFQASKDRVGQNLAQNTLTPPPKRGPSIMVKREKVEYYLNAFYEEIRDTTAEVVDKFPSPDDYDKMIGHFTQLVADVSFYVGCWRSATTNLAKSYLACNYGPQGNDVGKPVYRRGPPCTACKNGAQCNAKYTALCGEVDESRYYPANDTNVPVTGSVALCSTDLVFVCLTILLDILV